MVLMCDILMFLSSSSFEEAGLFLNILYFFNINVKPSRGGLEVERLLHKRRDSALVGSNPV